MLVLDDTTTSSLISIMSRMTPPSTTKKNHPPTKSPRHWRDLIVKWIKKRVSRTYLYESVSTLYLLLLAPRKPYSIYHFERNRPSNPARRTWVALPSRVERRNTFGSLGMRLAIANIMWNLPTSGELSRTPRQKMGLPPMKQQ